MTVTVVDAMGEVELELTGKAPVIPEIEADNARRGLKAPEKAEAATAPKPAAKNGEADPDDVEGEDGLTPRQKRELTDKMLRSIGKKHAKLKEAEEVAATHYADRVAADRRVQLLEEENRQLKAATAPKQEPAKPEPKREAYQTEAEYVKALGAWSAEEKFRELQAESAKNQEEARQAEIRDNAAAMVAKARKLVPDWEDTVTGAETNVPAHIGAYMQESPLFAELVYHFAKDPEALERLAKMPTRTFSDVERVGVAIGKIEGMLKPFAAAGKAAAKHDEDGEEPNETEDGEAEEPETPKPTTAAAPSKPRAAAPVIQPLTSGSATQVETPAREKSYAAARSDWEKRKGVSLSLRKRH